MFDSFSISSLWLRFQRSTYEVLTFSTLNLSLWSSALRLCNTAKWSLHCFSFFAVVTAAYPDNVGTINKGQLWWLHCLFSIWLLQYSTSSMFYQLCCFAPYIFNKVHVGASMRVQTSCVDMATGTAWPLPHKTKQTTIIAENNPFISSGPCHSCLVAVTWSLRCYFHFRMAFKWVLTTHFSSNLKQSTLSLKHSSCQIDVIYSHKMYISTYWQIKEFVDMQIIGI